MPQLNDSADLRAKLERAEQEICLRTKRMTGTHGYISHNERERRELRRSLGEVNTLWGVGELVMLTSRRRLVGPLLTILKKIIRRLARFYIGALMNQQREYNSAVAKLLSMIVERLDVLDTRMMHLEASVRNLTSDAREQAKVTENLVEPDQPSTSTRSPALDYWAFELRFRGTPAEVKEKQHIFVEYFRGTGRVLEIGCGRGEFLELLRENGINGLGIESDPEMVDYCRNLGLEVKLADAVEYLRTLSDDSLGGVFTSQVVEHLQPRYLVEMLGLCFHKLKPGGRLIAETINPTSLTAVTSAFYLDLSHVKPIHPETLAFLLERAGFTDISFRHSTPVDAKTMLKSIDLQRRLSKKERHLYDLLNENFEKLNRMLYGFQDYAAIARKP